MFTNEEKARAAYDEVKADYDEQGDENQQVSFEIETIDDATGEPQNFRFSDESALAA